MRPDLLCLLDVEGLGGEADFFELGGHSLLAIRLVSALRKELAIEMAIEDVSQRKSVADFPLRPAQRRESPLAEL